MAANIIKIKSSNQTFFNLLKTFIVINFYAHYAFKFLSILREMHFMLRIIKRRLFNQISEELIAIDYYFLMSTIKL